VDNELNYAEGEYYIAKIINFIEKNYSRDKEIELKFRIIQSLILKERDANLFREYLTKVNKLKDSNLNILDKSFVDDLNDKLI
jgi:hypothetical protein